MSDYVQIRARLDPASMNTLARLEDYTSVLFPVMKAAMAESANEVEAQAQAWMYAMFQNPIGALEEAFEVTTFGPFSAWVVNDEPYAQRRNYGFSGMTDSLGRFYADDPGIMWAENAIQNAVPTVAQIWQTYLDSIGGF